jgi:hypothetical protein
MFNVIFFSLFGVGMRKYTAIIYYIVEEALEEFFFILQQS